MLRGAYTTTTTNHHNHQHQHHHHQQCVPGCPQPCRWPRVVDATRRARDQRGSTQPAPDPVPARWQRCDTVRVASDWLWWLALLLLAPLPPIRDECWWLIVVVHSMRSTYSSLYSTTTRTFCNCVGSFCPNILYNDLKRKQKKIIKNCFFFFFCFEKMIYFFSICQN